MAVSSETPTFAPVTKIQGRSPVGLERCSHIAEVPGSSPGVPTQIFESFSRQPYKFLLYGCLFCAIMLARLSVIAWETKRPRFVLVEKGYGKTLTAPLPMPHSLHPVLIHSPVFACFDKFAFQFFRKKSYNLKFSYYLCREFLEFISNGHTERTEDESHGLPHSVHDIPMRASLSRTITDIPHSYCALTYTTISLPSFIFREPFAVLSRIT